MRSAATVLAHLGRCRTHDPPARRAFATARVTGNRRSTARSRFRTRPPRPARAGTPAPLADTAAALSVGARGDRAAAHFDRRSSYGRGPGPGYDPYGWLVWGKLTVHLKLDTNGAPSWKPLPFLFTVPYAVVGHYALWLWMITSVAISLAGPIFAWRIAFRLTDAPPAAPLRGVRGGCVRGCGAARDPATTRTSSSAPSRTR